MKDRIDYIHKWALALFLPLIGVLVGYQTLFTKTQTLAESDKRYVMVQAFKPIDDSIKTEIPILFRKVNDHEAAVQRMDANLANIKQLLEEVRGDLKKLTQK